MYATPPKPSPSSEDTSPREYLSGAPRISKTLEIIAFAVKQLKWDCEQYPEAYQNGAASEAMSIFMDSGKREIDDGSHAVRCALAPYLDAQREAQDAQREAEFLRQKPELLAKALTKFQDALAEDWKRVPEAMHYERRTQVVVKRYTPLNKRRDYVTGCPLYLLVRNGIPQFAACSKAEATRFLHWSRGVKYAESYARLLGITEEVRAKCHEIIGVDLGHIATYTEVASPADICGYDAYGSASSA